LIRELANQIPGAVDFKGVELDVGFHYC
jgi:hypothetical protein